MSTQYAAADKGDPPQKSYFFTGENVDFSNERIHMMASKDEGGGFRNPE